MRLKLSWGRLGVSGELRSITVEASGRTDLRSRNNESKRRHIDDASEIVRRLSASKSVTGASGVEGVSREAILKYRLICILISIATYSNIDLCKYRFDYGFIWILHHFIITCFEGRSLYWKIAVFEYRFIRVSL